MHRILLCRAGGLASKVECCRDLSLSRCQAVVWPCSRLIRALQPMLTVSLPSSPATPPPAGPNIFAGRLSDDQRQLMQSSPDVPPPAGLFGGPPGGSLVTPQLVLTGRP